MHVMIMKTASIVWRLDENHSELHVGMRQKITYTSE
jgi:hypothetical protein